MSQTMLIEVTVDTVEAMWTLGETVGQLCQSGDIIGLDGELGAGKTQFVRGLAKGIGLSPQAVSSPTFVFAHEYEPTGDDGLTLIHVDAYRLEAHGDLESIGLDIDDDEFREQTVLAFEWFERVAEALKQHIVLRIDITHAAVGRRVVMSCDTDESRAVWEPRLARVK